MQANIIPFLLYALHLRPTRARTPTHGTYDIRASLSRGRRARLWEYNVVSIAVPRRRRPRVTPGHFVWTRTRRVGRRSETARVVDTRPLSPRAKGHRTDALGHRARAGGRPRTCFAPLRTRYVLAYVIPKRRSAKFVNRTLYVTVFI
ncbi:unnamed protein product, partial [Iphiclides podalirius]